MVVRAPHGRWGEVPVVVVGEGGSPGPPLLHATPRLPELPELRAVVSAALGRAAAPDRLVLLPELPLLASGKPDRRALEALVAGGDLARN